MPLLHLQPRDGWVELVLDRPKVNAMSLELITAIADTLERLALEDDARGVLVRSALGCFCAGLDLVEVAGLDEAGAHRFLAALDRAFLAGWLLPKPLAVAIEGHAIAGGLIIGLTADFLALGRGSYKLGLSELRVGVPFPRVPYEIVRHSLSPRALRKLVLEPDNIAPEEAFALGVGDRLSDAPLDEARAWLAAAIARPAGAFRLTKALSRSEARERIATHAEPERAELVRELLKARDALLATLGNR